MNESVRPRPSEEDGMDRGPGGAGALEPSLQPTFGSSWQPGRCVLRIQGVKVL